MRRFAILVVGWATIVVALWAHVASAGTVDAASVLATLERAGWHLESVRPSLPSAEVVADDRLEVFDWIERAYVGGRVRLYGSREDQRIFAILFEGTAAAAARVRTTPQRDVWSFADCTVILPSHELTAAQFGRLRNEPLTPAMLRRHAGAWSYWWHAHGWGYEFVEYVPEGLSFVVLRPRDGDTRYYAVDPSAMADGTERAMMANEAEPAPSSYAEQLTYEAYVGGRRSYRRGFARQLCRNRKRVRRYLARGLPSPDGRFVVAPVNLGGTYNNQQTAIQEVGKAERLYRAEYFMRFGDYCWLNAHTVLYRVHGPVDGDIIALDAASGEKRHVLHLADSDSSSRGHNFGCLGEGRFWYTTRDGLRHEAKAVRCSR